MVFGNNNKGKFTKDQPKEVVLTDPSVHHNIEIEDPVEYTSQAFSMGRHPEGGFALITVDFNPVTMHAKVSEVKKVGDSREDAEYFFKIRVGEFFAAQEGR